MTGRVFRVLCPVTLFLCLVVDDATAKIVYVDANATGDGSGADWGNACTTITEGLAAASWGDAVWVKSATYEEAISLSRGIALYGGFPSDGTPAFEDRDWRLNVTVIDASGVGTSAVFVEGTYRTILDGFTITGGNAETGGGVYCSGIEPTFRHCVIIGNSAAGDGGGVCFRSSSPIIEDCTLIQNGASVSGGGAKFFRGSPKLVRCYIAENEAMYSGGIDLDQASATITACTIERNSAWSGGGLSSFYSLAIAGSMFVRNTATDRGGGLRCGGSAAIRDCSFVENSAKRGGGLWLYDPRSALDIERCVIAGNGADEGGGVYCDSASPRLSNCLITGNFANLGGGLFSGIYSAPKLFNSTIVNNSAQLGTGGGLYLNPSSCEPWDESDPPDIVMNSILWDNLPDQIAALNPSCTPQVNCCDVSGGWPGPGNINATPEFIHPWDGVFGDYHLLPGSPCIDAGSNEAAAGILTDLDGNVRTWDGDDVPGAVVDMGAYEFGSVPPSPTPTPTLPPTPTPTPIVGDINRDGRIDDMDLFLFSREWWKSQ